MSSVPVVYGDRVCPICHGLLSGGSFRTTGGQRHRYFCSKSCVERFLSGELKKYLPKGFSVSRDMVDEMFLWQMDNGFLEKVFVQQRR